MLAFAAHDLSTKLQGMSLANYSALAAVLDNAKVAYPPCFCMKALMHVAHAKQAAGVPSDVILDMFVLKAQLDTPEHRFKAAAPRLQDINQLRAGDVEQALVDGLFSTVLLQLMKLPTGVYAAKAAAEALRDACAAASIMALAAAVTVSGHTPSIMAGPSSAATFVPLAAAQWVWIADMQDAACVIIGMATDELSTQYIEALQRVQAATSGPRKLLGISLKREPWCAMCSTRRAIMSQIHEAIQTCTSDPEVWLKAAALVPVWKTEVPPGTTTQLEELLWMVLLLAWGQFNTGDRHCATALLNRIRLARRLVAPNRPDDMGIDMMELTVPRPKLIVPIQSCRPKLQPRALLRLQHTHT